MTTWPFLVMSIWVADKIIYYSQLTWPKGSPIGSECFAVLKILYMRHNLWIRRMGSIPCNFCTDSCLIWENMLHVFTVRVSELELESLEKLDSEVLWPTFVDLQFSWKVIPVYAFLWGLSRSFAGSSDKQVVKFTLVGRALKTWL